MYNKINSNINFNGNMFQRIQERRQRSADNRLDKFIAEMAKSANSKEKVPIQYNLKRGTEILLGIDNNRQLVKSNLISGYVDPERYCIFLHGGTSTIPNYQYFIEWLNLDFTNVLAVEYPGYGKNAKLKPTYTNIRETAKSAYDYLRNTLKVKPENINILGYCFGAPVATDLASKVDCHSLMLLSPITSLTQMSKGYLDSKQTSLRFSEKVKNFFALRFHTRPIKFDRLNTFSGIENINCPIYLMSSHDDPVTGIKWADNFLEYASKKGKQVTYIKGFEAGHALTKSKANFLAKLMRTMSKNPLTFF